MLMTFSFKVEKIFFLSNIKLYLILFQNWLPIEQWTFPLEKVGQGKSDNILPLSIHLENNLAKQLEEEDKLFWQSNSTSTAVCLSIRQNPIHDPKSKHSRQTKSKCSCRRLSGEEPKHLLPTLKHINWEVDQTKCCQHQRQKPGEVQNQEAKTMKDGFCNFLQPISKILVEILEYAG